MLKILLLSLALAVTAVPETALLKFNQNGKQLRIELPSQAPNPHVSVVELMKK